MTVTITVPMAKGSLKMRPIDADALISYFEEQYNTAMDDPDPVSGYVMAALRCCIDYFNTAPTVEAVVLPLKPGDIVYYMNRYRRKVWPMKIISVEINSQGISEYGCWCDVPESYTPVCFRPISIGKNVFFTQEEAEAALAKMKGGASHA